MRFIILCIFCVLCNIYASTSIFEEIIGDSLYTWTSEESIEQRSTSELLKGKSTIALYFSASWCRPCQQFTPMLAKFYNEMKKKNKSFEIIWISQDRSTEEFAAYYQKMPWLALPVEAIKEKLEYLSSLYKVKGIPHLVILDEDGSIITIDGRTMVAKDPYGLEFPWKPRTLSTLIPKPIKKFIVSETKKLQEKGLNILKGAASSLAPPKIIHFFKVKVIPQVSNVIIKIYDVINQKMTEA